MTTSDRRCARVNGTVGAYRAVARRTHDPPVAGAIASNRRGDRCWVPRWVKIRKARTSSRKPKGDKTPSPNKTAKAVLR